MVIERGNKSTGGRKWERKEKAGGKKEVLKTPSA